MSVALLRGNALALPLADESVDLIVTSPPFFALRSYTDGGVHYAGQLGSEATPAEFLDALIAATREMVRVLKPSGSIFVNLGDKYNSAQSGQQSALRNGALMQEARERGLVTGGRGSAVDRYPQKSLMLIPERYRIRCVDELGLICRAVVVWSKPNGLPESVTDRARRSHEDWVHLTKAPRYYAAIDEIREAYAPGTATRYAAGYNARKVDAARRSVNTNLGGDTYDENPLGKLPGSVWTVPTQPLTVPAELGVDHFAAFPMEWPRRLILGWSPPGICTACGEGRRPVSAAEDVERTARRDALAARQRRTSVVNGGRAGTALGVNAGERNRTITGYVCACTPYTDHPGTGESSKLGDTRATGLPERSRAGDVGGAPRTGPWREYHFDRWTPAPTRPAVVLDPFGGTGTTVLVADALGRHGIGVDMSADYCRIARWRTTDPGQRAAALQVEKPAPVAPAQDDLLALLDGEASA